MKIIFCGAATTVTGSCHLLTLVDGYTILMDAGLYQGREEKFIHFNSRWVFEPSTIDCLILSHAHIDHSGRIPKLVKDGFNGEIICTSATRDLTAVMLMDSAKIQERDAYFMNKQKRKKGLKEDAEPLYTIEDVFNCMQNFVGISYDTWHRISDNVSVLLRDSGHIFGSASVTLKIDENGKRSIIVGFSGDIGRPNRPILRDPVPMENLDYLICESTYGGVIHDNLSNDQARLLRIIKETCIDKEGKLIIPAFSVGRTQEIVYTLDKLERENKLPRIQVFVDSPMAINATEIFKLHPECFDSEIIKYMIDDPNPFGFNNLKYIRDSEESKKLNNFKGPAIIISASGMMTGGRILHHLLNHIEDSINTVLIVGYCANHTLGARLREGEKRVQIFGIEKEVKARIEIMDSFSAHADEPEIMDYLSNLDKNKLNNIFLVHGELDRQYKLKSALEREGFNNIEIPAFGDERVLRH
jgi:metallo-beta-lactamase family protein